MTTTDDWGEWVARLAGSDRPVERVLSEASRRFGLTLRRVDADREAPSPADRRYVDLAGRVLVLTSDDRGPAAPLSAHALRWLDASMAAAGSYVPLGQDHVWRRLKMLLEGLDHALRGKLNLLSLSLSSIETGVAPSDLSSSVILRLQELPSTIARFLTEAVEYGESLIDCEDPCEALATYAALVARVDASVEKRVPEESPPLEWSGVANGLDSVTLNRVASVLEPLLTSCVRSSADTGVVRIAVDVREDAVEFLVHDQGPKLPARPTTIWKPFSRRPGVRGSPGIDAQRALALLRAESAGYGLDAIADDPSARFRLTVPLSGID